jgi:hypothetical protein
MAAEDTSASTLSLYTALPRSSLQQAEQASELSPHLFMQVSGTRAWIPFHVDPKESFERGTWGATERGEDGFNPKGDLVILRIDFTALGFGHYHLTDTLTTRSSKWRQWRFHGTLPLPAKSTDGQLLACVGDILKVE